MKIKTTINLREEMNEILEEYGVWVLYHRLSNRLNCECWNEKYKEGLSTCTKCGGSGWISRLERHRMRQVGAAIPISEPNLTLETEMGHMLTQQYRWFMAHNVHPKSGDRIYQVLWDPKNPNKPIALAGTHFINNASDNRADNGQIAYYEAATRTVTTNMKIENIMIRSMGPIKNYFVGG